MPAKITDIRIYPELSAQPVDWLLGNVFGKHRAEIDFYISANALATPDNTFIFNPSAGYIGAGWIIAEQADAFKEFRIDDTLYIDTIPVSGTFTVVDKISDNEIQVSPNTGAPDDSIASDGAIFVTTQITGMKFFHNMVENSEQADYFSKIDGSEQLQIRKDVDCVDITVRDMFNQLPLPWQYSNAQIKGVTFVDFKQTFTLIHYFFIGPFFLADQWDDLKAGIAPSYLFNGKSLKYVFKIQAMYDFNDPNRFQEIEVSETLGNVGWFGENFNKGESAYEIGSVIFKTLADVVIPGITLSENEIKGEVTITNFTDNPFSNNNTKFVLNFIKAPSDPSEYQNNGKNVQENFFFDRALQTVGSAPIDGDEFATQWQVLKDVEAEFISASEIKLKFRIALSSFIVSELAELDIARYILAVEIQDHTLATAIADNVCLLIDAQDFFIDNSDPGLLVSSTRFLRHFENTFEQGQSGVEVFPEDEVVAYSRIYIDRATREADSIIIKKVEANMIAKNSVSGESFILDTFSLDTSGLAFIGDSQFIDFSLDRVFHIPIAEIRKKIKITRRQDLDESQRRYYDIVIPYLIRWEYFTALTNVNADFFDTSEPNNGWNQFWHHYTTLTDWGLYYNQKILVSKNGDPLLYESDIQLLSDDYDSNPDWEPDGIKSFNNATNVQLYDVGTMRNFLLGFEATRIEATFTKISGAPILANCYVVFGIEVFEQGGIAGRRRISSVYPLEDTWFKSVDNSNKIVLSLSGNTITAKALIDNTLIPLNVRAFKITARIYEFGAAPSLAKQFEDGSAFEFEDGAIYEFEN